jgi:hypothetical protein
MNILCGSSSLSKTISIDLKEISFFLNSLVRNKQKLKKKSIHLSLKFKCCNIPQRGKENKQVGSEAGSSFSPKRQRKKEEAAAANNSNMQRSC